MAPTGIRRKCVRCKYEWKSRLKRRPRQCPNCKNPKWDQRPDEDEVTGEDAKDAAEAPKMAAK